MSDDLTLRHHVRRDFQPVGLCVWCGQPTPSVAETPFRPDLGALPLGLMCGAKMRLAYRDLLAGRSLDWAADGMARLAALPMKELTP